MTIDWRILIEENELSDAKVEEIVKSTFTEIDALYNRYNPNSELSNLNRAEGGKEILLSRKLYLFLLKTKELVDFTEGRFDPTVLPALLLFESALKEGHLPTEEETSALPIGFDKLHFTERGVIKQESGVMLDLGGIAKGFAIDLLLEKLKEAGAKNLFVEWGGEMRALGKHPEGREWVVGLFDPKRHQEYQRAPLTERAVATSGDYEQKWCISGREFCHIVDPKTHALREVKEGKITSATVFAPTCMVADAVATALLLFTPEEAQRFAEGKRESIPALEFYLLEDRRALPPEAPSLP